VDESADEIDMSFDRLSLCEKISINFGSLEVGNFVDVTANSASGPVVTGFGSLRASHFAGVVCDVDSCRVITINGCLLLRVADGTERSNMPCWPLMNRAPYSDSDAAVHTVGMRQQTGVIMPLMTKGAPLFVR
jgi:hypothetical protein